MFASINLDHADRLVGKPGSFPRAYGFVASDDVMRAVSLMVHNVIKELGGKDDFLGHLGPTDFVLITGPSKQPTCRIASAAAWNKPGLFLSDQRPRKVQLPHRRLVVKIGVLQGGRENLPPWISQVIFIAEKTVGETCTS